MTAPAASESPGGAGPTRLRLRANFTWAFGSTLFYSIAQWGMLVVLAKLGQAYMVGQWTLAQAICVPIMTLPALGLRGAMVTDARNEYTYGHYIGLRLVMAVATLIAIVGIALAARYDAGTATIIILTGISLGIMSVRDIIVGIMQKHERMDVGGRSQVLLGGLTLGGFAAVFAVSRSLSAAMAALILVRTAMLFLHDIPCSRRIAIAHQAETRSSSLKPVFSYRLLRLCAASLPLGAAMAAGSLQNNIPVYVLDAYHTKEQTGFYGAMVMILQALTVLVNTAGTATSPRLAKYFLSNRRAFWRLLGQLALLGLIIGAIVILVALFAGESALRIVFTPEYAEYAGDFCWMMVAAATIFLMSFLVFAIVAARGFWSLLVSYSFTMLVTLGVAFWLIPDGGTHGAVLTRLLSACASLASMGIALVIIAKRKAPETPCVSIVGSGASP